MSRTLIVFAVLSALVCGPACPKVSAEELHVEFLEGLREREYFDMALLYLDKLEQRNDLPAEIKQVLSYQRAITLLDGASAIDNPELREEQLNRAVAQLEAFTQAHPEHPLAGEANTQQARILIEKARVKIWESESPANKDNSEKLRLEARKLLTRARGIFQKAHDLHKAAYEKFNKFIPKEDTEQYEARAKAETAYMRAQIDLALCTYEEAQTHPRDSKEYKNLLTKAADEFAAIHEKYRSMVGGLYARMWQGKCFEEQDDIGKALGIYGELLDHPGDSQTMKTIQNQVKLFELICLNHDKRKDYQLVIKKAEEWLNLNRRLDSFTVSLGIRFQKAVAHEKMAEKLEADFSRSRRENPGQNPVRPREDIESHLRKAILDAQQVTQFAGQYKAPSQFMISRIKGKLGLDEGDPKTIEEVRVKAEKMWQDILTLESEVKAAKTKNEKTNREEALQTQLAEAARVLNLGLSFANEGTGSKILNDVRLLLCYVYYLEKRNYEAAVIGEFLATKLAHTTEENAGDLTHIAQQGATLARGAWYQEYESKQEQAAETDPEEDEDDGSFALDQLVRICRLITELWPASSLADESRMTLGRIYSKREQPAEAAKWFISVTSSELKGLAKASAGQAFWNAYLNGSELPEDKRPKSEDLAQWQVDAKTYLEDGLKQMNGDIPKDADAKTATDLILARVTLAQINIYEQDYDKAIFYLTEAKALHHSPLSAVKIPDEEPRPEKGVKSQRFASLVYQILLRAYVGKQQTNEALKTMNDLENLAGEGNTAELSSIYRELGEQIGKEVKRLQAEGPKERLDAILASFNTFLNFLYEPNRRKNMSPGSLQWMAETFLNLGVGLKEAPDADSQAKAAEYFQKAEECYRTIIDIGKRESDPPKWLTGMKLRLADASRAAGNFEAGLETIEEVLREYPQAPNVQAAAAQLLEDWGFADQPESPNRLLEAINGRKFEGQPEPNKNGIKGWMGLTVQYDLMLRPVRAQLRQLRDAEERIIAYENTLKERAERVNQLEAAKTLAQQEQAKQAEDALAVIDDALAATRTWLSLKMERDRLQAEGTDVARIEQINRFLSHMVDSQYYQKLASGALEEEYRKELAKLEKESQGDSKRAANKLKQMLEEIEQEKGEDGLLAAAFRTGQRIVKVREQLAVILQQEYDQLAVSANPGTEEMLEKLKAEIAAVKPQNLDEKRAREVLAEREALSKENRARSKEELQQELKILRNAVQAWTAYELVKSEAPGKLEELALDDDTLRASLEQKKAELADQIAQAEAREAELQDELMNALHHAVETRHKYAQVQSSNVEKEKALRAAHQDVLALTSRISRDEISTAWWNKFNEAYKEIRRDLKPFAKEGEVIDTAADLPVPSRVVASLTWLERPSNAPVTLASSPESESGAAAARPEPISKTWLILALLVALGGTGGVVYLMMGAQKKKPFRVNYGTGPLGGGDDKIVLPGQSATSTGSRPAKKTPSSGEPGGPGPPERPVAMPPAKPPPKNGLRNRPASRQNPDRNPGPRNKSPTKSDGRMSLTILLFGSLRNPPFSRIPINRLGAEELFVDEETRSCAGRPRGSAELGLVRGYCVPQRLR